MAKGNDKNNDNQEKRKKEKVESVDKNNMRMWKAGTFLFMGLFLITLSYVFTTGTSTFKTVEVTNIISKPCTESLGKKVVKYINENLVEVGSADFVNISDRGSYCEVITEYMGRKIPVYVTKDGKTMFLSAVDLTKPLRSKHEFDAPDKEIPEVKLFIMSFCPFGNQAEEAMKPVIDLLHEKIEFEPVYILYDYSDSYDSKNNTLVFRGMKFSVAMQNHPVYGKILLAYRNGTSCKYEGIPFLLSGNKILWSMHDYFCVDNLSDALPNEAIEDVIEKSVFSLYGEKVWAEFVARINNECNVQNVLDCWKNVAKSLNLSENAILEYYKAHRDDILERDFGLCEKYDAWGSPILIINGKKYEGMRTPNAFKDAICSGFKVKPEECGVELNSTKQATSGSCS